MKRVIFILGVMTCGVQAQTFHPIDESKSVEGEKPASSVKPQADVKTDLPEEQPKAAAEKGILISGVVRAVRGFPVTEVFFKDKNESYFIDPVSSHDQIMNACLQSSRTGQSVSLRVDPVSRHVLSLSEQNKPSSDQGLDSSKMSRGGSD